MTTLHDRPDPAGEPSTAQDARSAPAILHGGRLLAARRAFPDAPAPFIDLSTGINPVPYPVSPLPASAFARLPEPEHEAALRALAAGMHGAPDADHVAAAPGSQILISLLPVLTGCRRAAILQPTYGEHARSWAGAGVTPCAVSDADELESMAAPGTALVLCNPNNPDGRRMNGTGLARLAARCAAVGAVLVVDEAFADLEPGLPQAARLLPAPGLVVLRSFGKSFGLAGLRLGFLLAAPDLAGRMRALLGPWAVSGPALAAGREAMADREWRERAGRRLARDSRRLDALLAANGLQPLGGTVLFRLVAGGDGRAARLFDRLGSAGILVRRFEHQPDWLRFGLPPDEAAWSRLEAVLRG